ncbi:hypothetical protein V8F20_012826 [Naviculisporaceae sp. PSN 640]
MPIVVLKDRTKAVIAIIIKVVIRIIAVSANRTRKRVILTPLKRLLIATFIENQGKNNSKRIKIDGKGCKKRIDFLKENRVIINYLKRYKRSITKKINTIYEEQNIESIKIRISLIDLKA